MMCATSISHIKLLLCGMEHQDFYHAIHVLADQKRTMFLCLRQGSRQQLIVAGASVKLRSENASSCFAFPLVSQAAACVCSN